MARLQSTFIALFFLVSASAQTGTEPRQVEAVDSQTTGVLLDSYENWVMVSRLDTIGIEDYRYHHLRLADPHLFIVDDSICFTLVNVDTHCVHIQELLIQDYESTLGDGVLTDYEVVDFTIPDTTAYTSDEINSMLIVTRNGVRMQYSAAPTSRTQYQINNAGNEIILDPGFPLKASERLEVHLIRTP